MMFLIPVPSFFLKSLCSLICYDTAIIILCVCVCVCVTRSHFTQTYPHPSIPSVLSSFRVTDNCHISDSLLAIAA